MADTVFSQAGLNFNLYDPPWKGSNFVRSYTDDVVSYSHDISVLGGFIGASIQLKRQPANALEDWIENGLGREIKIKSGGQATAYEGFINRVEITIEGFHFSFGPFTDISNKLMLQYSLIDWSTGQAITGLKGSSGWVTDAKSIAKYGIQTKVLSTGGIQVDLIDELLALTMSKLKNPTRSEDLSVGSQGAIFDLRIDALGWGALLDKYPYNNTDYTFVNVSDKIKTIVAAEPNGLFNTKGVQLNTIQVSNWENDNTTAQAIIKGLVALGDSSNNRYLFGVYEDRTATYKQAEQIITYYRPLGEDLLTILDSANNPVPGWAVRPGTWVQVTDLLPTKKPLDPFTDVQKMFIESVSFKAPNSLILNGSQIFKLDQRLAQLGISGLGI